MTRGWTQWLRLGFRRGFWGTCAHLWQIGPGGLARRLRFGFRLFGVHARNRFFDWRHGTDTASGVPHRSLDMPTEQRQRASWYVPVPLHSFNYVLDHLPLEYPHYSFLDIGAGKGKAMYLASQYPFRQILGVEFAAMIAVTCRKNMAKLCRDDGAAVPWRLDVMNALEARLPDGPCFLFLYSPFSNTGINVFLARLEHWIKGRTQPLILCFVDDKGASSLLPEVITHCSSVGHWDRLSLPPLPRDPTALFPMEGAVFSFDPAAY